MSLHNTLSSLGLCMRSGNLTSGDFSVSEAIRKHNAHFVIVAEDASDNTKKKFRNLCSHYQVPLSIWCSKEQLGHAIGKEFRASIAIVDQGFSDMIRRQLDKEKSMEV